MRERKRVGGGPGRHQEDRDLMLEEFPRTCARPARSRCRGPRRERGACIRARNGGEDVRRDPRRVVAAKFMRSFLLDRMQF